MLGQGSSPSESSRPSRARAVSTTSPAQAKFDRIIFRIIPDDNVRLANLRSGDIDVMHQVAPTDATAIKREARFELSSVTGLGYQGITINLRNKSGKQNPPGDLGTAMANDPRVREAFDLSIDREALNQVAWDESSRPAERHPDQRVRERRAVPARDVAKPSCAADRAAKGTASSDGGHNPRAPRGAK